MTVPKFKAWNKKRQRWEHPVWAEHGFTEKGVLYVGETIEHGTHDEFNEFELVQFTGLRDKNGVEIYEGDVLRVDDPDGEFVDVGIGLIQVAEFPSAQLRPVEFREAVFGCEIKQSLNHTSGFYSLQEIKENCSDLEVIGNIYESNELVEQSHKTKNI